MTKYQKQTRILVAVDCIIFGFDGQTMNLLLIKRGFEPERNKWSLMGGFVEPEESADEAAVKILKKLTGLDGVYLEQLHTFSEHARDPIERTMSIAYSALIDTNQYETQISDEYHAEWVPLNKVPTLIFDHKKMVAMAKEKLKYKAAIHPILFELLPAKFTLPVLLNLFESVYDTSFDKRNFNRKIMSTGLLLKLKEKDKTGSKKGAFYFKLDKKHYHKNFHKFLNFIPNPNGLIK
jgi:ADP-ribose pyrophosphatase YjhB (NUDIX family)